MIRLNRRSVPLPRTTKMFRVAVWVGLLGVAYALSGCPKMKKRQEYNAMLWTAEVNENIERIYQGLTRHRARAKDKDSYRFPSDGPTPAHIPCGKKPHAPDAKLWQSVGWKELGFSIGEKFRYQYRIISTGTGLKARFTIRAHADLDCDGVYSTYERSGTIDATGRLIDGLLDWDKAKEIE